MAYKQVEPNRLSAQRTGRMISQSPVAAATVADLGVIQNGQFFSLQGGELVLGAEGPIAGLNYSEVKLYEARHTNKDFALKSEAGLPVFPRILQLEVGDIYTTDAFEGAPAKGAKLAVNAATGLLAAGGTGIYEVEVVAQTTLADGTAAIKVIVTKDTAVAGA